MTFLLLVVTTMSMFVSFMALYAYMRCSVRSDNAIKKANEHISFLSKWRKRYSRRIATAMIEVKHNKRLTDMNENQRVTIVKQNDLIKLFARYLLLDQKVHSGKYRRWEYQEWRNRYKEIVWSLIESSPIEITSLSTQLRMLKVPKPKGWENHHSALNEKAQTAQTAMASVNIAMNGVYGKVEKKG